MSDPKRREAGAAMMRKVYGDVVPVPPEGSGAFADTMLEQLFGEVWTREQLSLRDRRLLTMGVIAALAASAVAIWVGRAILGNTPEFTAPPLTAPGLDQLPFFAVLGIAAGLAGTLYNRTLLATLRMTDRFPGLRVEWRAAIVGAAVGAIAWCAPWLVGGGDGLAQHEWLFCQRLECVGGFYPAHVRPRHRGVSGTAKLFAQWLGGGCRS